MTEENTKAENESDFSLNYRDRIESANQEDHHWIISAIVKHIYKKRYITSSQYREAWSMAKNEAYYETVQLLAPKGWILWGLNKELTLWRASFIHNKTQQQINGRGNTETLALFIAIITIYEKELTNV